MFWKSAQLFDRNQVKYGGAAPGSRCVLKQRALSEGRMYGIGFNDIESKGFQSETGHVHQTSYGKGVTTVLIKEAPPKEQVYS